MKINVTQMPETKVFTDRFKHYTQTFPDGYPVHVRCVWNCKDCGVEVGGYFGNRVYGDHKTGLCTACSDKKDPLVQMCVRQTGLTPTEYQKRHKVAWNE